MSSRPHKTVLLQETIQSLDLHSGDIAIDCTVGGGGHTLALAKAVGPTGRVLGIDRDQSALKLAHDYLGKGESQATVELIHGTFSQIASIAQDRHLTGKVSGIVADIGVSSMHLDLVERGFSFQTNGPLDMRMDPTQELTAATIVNKASEDELTSLFYRYGEEPKARHVARVIISAREASPIETTKALADLIADRIHYPNPSRKHPATRVFQALRIAVNDELSELRTLLQNAFNLLAPGGRLAIITFHSLEDRMVKEVYRDLCGKTQAAHLPRHLPIDAKTLAAQSPLHGRIVKPFPLVPSQKEIDENPRARSAKLRVLAKI